MVVACTEPVVENTPAEDKIPGAGVLTEAPDVVEKTDVAKQLLAELLQQSQNVGAEKVEIKGKYKGSITSSFLTPEPENIYEAEDWVEFDMTFLNALLGADASAPLTEVFKNLILGGAYEDGDEFIAGLANSLDFSKIEEEYGSLDNFMTASSASAICFAIVSALAESDKISELPLELQEYIFTLSENATDFALKLANGTANFETLFDFIVPESDFGDAIDAIRAGWDGEGNENIEVYFEAFKEYIPSIYYSFALYTNFMPTDYDSELAINALTEYLGSENGPFAKGDFAGVLLAFYGAAVTDVFNITIQELFFYERTLYYDMVTEKWYDYYCEELELPEGFDVHVNSVDAFVLDVDEYIGVHFYSYEDACAFRDELGLNCAILQYCSGYITKDGLAFEEYAAEIYGILYEKICDVIDSGDYDCDTKLALVLSVISYVIANAPAENMVGRINAMLALQLMVSIYGNGVIDGLEDACVEIVNLIEADVLYDSDVEVIVEQLLDEIMVKVDEDDGTVDILIKAVVDILMDGALGYDSIIFDGINVTDGLAELIYQIYNGEFHGTVSPGLAVAMLTAYIYFANIDFVNDQFSAYINELMENGEYDSELYDEYRREYTKGVMYDIFTVTADEIYEYAYEDYEDLRELSVLEVLGFIYKYNALAGVEDPDYYFEITNEFENYESAATYLVANVFCDIMRPLHEAKATRYAIDLETGEFSESMYEQKIYMYEQIVKLTVVSFLDNEYMGDTIPVIIIPVFHIMYILDAYETSDMSFIINDIASKALEVFMDDYILGLQDAMITSATEHITEADVEIEGINKTVYVLGYNAAVDGNTNSPLGTITLTEAYEYIYIPYIFSEPDGLDGEENPLADLIMVFYANRGIEIDYYDAKSYAHAIINVYNDAVNDGMTAAETLEIVAYYVYNHSTDLEEGSIAYNFIVNVFAIIDVITDDEFEYSDKALYEVMLKQFYGDNEYVNAVIELLGKPGKESVRENLKLLVSLIIDDGKGDIFVDIAIAMFTGDKDELVALLEEVSGVEDYALGTTVLSLVAHYLGGFGDLDEDIATVIEAFQIYGIATEMIEELFGEELYPDFTKVMQAITDALNAETIDPVHLALDIMVAEGVFDGIAIPDKSYEYYYEELIALLGAFNIFMREGLNFYDAKNCANVTLLVLTDMENIEDYALRLLTVEEKLFNVGSQLWVVYAGLSTMAHLEYEDESIVDWERVLDYIEILVPEMTVQNYAALAALLRDAAETIVTDVKTEITLVTHNELETVYYYTIVGTVSAEDIFECELNIVLEMTVSNV
jgi:hypothetical protein